MAMKNMVEVVIAGKVFKVGGYESAEYLHQVSVYVNEKLSELQEMESYRRQNADQKQMTLTMNLADDFFKAKQQVDKLLAELEKKERELYSVRHDLIEAQMSKEKLEQENAEKLSKAEKDRKDLQKELQTLQKQIIRLEAEADRKPSEDPACSQSKYPK